MEEIKFFPSLFQCIDFLKNKKHLHIWAQDIAKNTIHDNGNSMINDRTRTVKKFLVSSSEILFNHLKQTNYPSFYEIIHFPEPVKFYLDIDLKYNFKNSDNLFLIKTEKSIIEIFLNLIDKFFLKIFSSSSLENPVFLVLSSSNKDKFSFHILVQNMIFENSCLSLYFFVLYLNNYIYKKIENKKYFKYTAYINLENNEKIFVEKTLLYNINNLIDLTVYKKTQMFRLLGCCKQNKKENPFLIVEYNIVFSYFLNNVINR